MRHRLFVLLALTSSFVITASTYAEQTASFSLQSSSFRDRNTIPALYTCDGQDRSPQLAWRGAPAKTASYVLICDDPDAPTGLWYHWVLYNIPASVSELPAGVEQPAGAVLGQNSWGRLRYNGPCPPVSSVHRYHFTLYALDRRLELPSGLDAQAVLNAIHGHVLGKATLRGVFGR